MPKSATGISDRGLDSGRLHRPVLMPAPIGRSSAGFTLIEVLVVVAIAAVVTVLVLLRLGDAAAPDRADRQLERLAVLIQAQCEQALFQSRPRGVRVLPTGYDFWQRADGGWVLLAGDGINQPRSFGDGSRVEFDVDGHPARLHAEIEAPQLTCEPLGGVTSFVLTLQVGDQRARLVTENGTPQLKVL